MEFFILRTLIILDVSQSLSPNMNLDLKKQHTRLVIFSYNPPQITLVATLSIISSEPLEFRQHQQSLPILRSKKAHVHFPQDADGFGFYAETFSAPGIGSGARCEIELSPTRKCVGVSRIT